MIVVLVLLMMMVVVMMMMIIIIIIIMQLVKLINAIVMRPKIHYCLSLNTIQNISIHLQRSQLLSRNLPPFPSLSLSCVMCSECCVKTLPINILCISSSPLSSYRNSKDFDVVTTPGRSNLYKLHQ